MTVLNIGCVNSIALVVEHIHIFAIKYITVFVLVINCFSLLFYHAYMTRKRISQI